MVLFGDILDRDRFREDFQRGVEYVFFPTRNGPQLFRRDRTGLLRRMRMPHQLEFIDIRRQLIAVAEDCTFQVHRLPRNWEWRYLRNRNTGPEILGLESAALNQFGTGLGGPGFPGGGLLEGCLTGGCGGGGGFGASETLVQQDIAVSSTEYGVSAFDGLGGYGGVGGYGGYGGVGGFGGGANYPHGFY